MFRKLKINRVLSALFAFLLAFNAFGSSIAYANANVGTTNAPEDFVSSSAGLISVFHGLAEMSIMPNILLIEDVNPWGVTSHHHLLQSMGQVRQVSSGALWGTNLASYDVIILSNDQWDSTYRNLDQSMWLLEEYVENGGVLVFGAADQGWNSWGWGLTSNLPGGVVSLGWSGHNNNYIYDFSHPIVTGELTNGIALTNDDLWGHVTSHTSFLEESIPNGRVILRDPNGYPTLIEYSLGNGTVIASGLTWEFGLEHGWDRYHRFSEIALADLYMHAISVAAGNLFFNVSSAGGRPGDFVDITISTTNISETGVAGFAFELGFDNSQIQPAMLMNSGEIFNIHTNLTDPSIDISNLNSVTAVWSNPSNIYVNGDLFTIRFNINPGASTGMHSISLSGMTTNDALEYIRFGITPGYIIITDELVYGDIHTDGFIDIRDVVKLSQYLAGRRDLNEFERLAADVYRDGRVDIRDAIKLSQYLAGHENIILGTR